MLRIITDTGSDITYNAAKKMGITSLEIDVKFEGIEYDYRSDEDFSVFFKNLINSKNLPSTSQVTPAQYLEEFKAAKEAGDEVLVITLSSGLSATIQSAHMAQKEIEYNQISIVDSKSAVLAQRILINEAIKLNEQGVARLEIADWLTELRERISLFGCLDTLTYLKKGGRVPPAMAFIGNALKIKPIVFVQNADGKLGSLGKPRGTAAAKSIVWKKMEEEGFDEKYSVQFGCTGDPVYGREFMNETVEKLKIKSSEYHPIGPVIGTHIGPRAFVATYIRK